MKFVKFSFKILKILLFIVIIEYGQGGIDPLSIVCNYCRIIIDYLDHLKNYYWLRLLLIEK